MMTTDEFIKNAIAKQTPEENEKLRQDIEHYRAQVLERLPTILPIGSLVEVTREALQEITGIVGCKAIVERYVTEASLPYVEVRLQDGAHAGELLWLFYNEHQGDECKVVQRAG